MLFQPSTLFTSGCVLARDREIRIFGAAQEGARITAELRDAEGALLCQGFAQERGGRFELLLPPQPAQTGCTLTLLGGGQIHRALDVAIGELWLAGGQSNMELALCNADGGMTTVSAVDEPLLRYYNVPKHAIAGEAADQANAAARWQPFAAGQGGDMSAVAAYFALRLRERLGVPVGIVDCWWGGTSIACWMEREALSRLAEGQRYLAEWDAAAAGISLETYLEREAAFLRDMDAWNSLVARLKAEHPGAPWSELAPLAGECPWNPPLGPGSPYRPCGLAETMLRRVTPLALTGILYYQGEEDAGRTTRYSELMMGLIAHWRRLFRDPDLPFLITQLPMWIAAGQEDIGQWAALRRQQELAWRQTRHTGLAVTIDLGEYDNIHPTDKRPVGERLAEQALMVAHGLPGAESPRALSKRAEDGGLTVLLSAPVCRRPGRESLLEVAGSDGVWHAAEAEISGAALHLRCPEVPCPVAVRYAWRDWAEVPFFGENGLPLAPFLLEG